MNKNDIISFLSQVLFSFSNDYESEGGRNRAMLSCFRLKIYFLLMWLGESSCSLRHASILFWVFFQKHNPSRGSWRNFSIWKLEKLLEDFKIQLHYRFWSYSQCFTRTVHYIFSKFFVNIADNHLTLLYWYPSFSLWTIFSSSVIVFCNTFSRFSINCF